MRQSSTRSLSLVSVQPSLAHLCTCAKRGKKLGQPDGLPIKGLGVWLRLRLHMWGIGPRIMREMVRSELATRISNYARNSPWDAFFFVLFVLPWHENFLFIIQTVLRTWKNSLRMLEKSDWSLRRAVEINFYLYACFILDRFDDDNILLTLRCSATYTPIRAAVCWPWTGDYSSPRATSLSARTSLARLTSRWNVPLFG